MIDLDLANYKVSPLTLTFLIKGDEILTLKRSSNKKIYPNKISGFGGKVEPGEDLLASAKREFLEETGLTLKEISLRGMFMRMMDTGYLNQMYLFVANEFEGEPKEISDEGEIQWLKIENFLNHPDIVDHVPLYLRQIIEGKDFYCGMGTYNQDTMTSYTSNESHFDERRN
ncbi:MAG: NUDIX domain-containing protein [Patescibacteria group bacterium]|jgi:8-oxo-dGTP diphosphatase